MITAKQMYDLVEEKKTPSENFVNIIGAIGSFIFGSIESIVIALAITVVLYLFFLTPHEVVGSSMIPNFKTGDYLLANKTIYKFNKPQRGEVVIFKYSETEDYIKRVIGLPGDTISIKDGRYYVNGGLLDEDEYLDASVYTNGENYLHEGESIIIPEGEYFVSGDNRQHSTDSREFGTISLESIKGRVWLRYFPFNTFWVVEHAKYN
jgi:signal peptidase I